MNIFNVHNQVIGEYSKYISSFLDIANPRIRAAVEEYFNSHKLWPQPLLQFNPSYELSESTNELHPNNIRFLPENEPIKYIIRSDSRREFLKRLLELNHKIHEEEVKAGLWDKPKAKRPGKTPPNLGQEGLFG